MELSEYYYVNNVQDIKKRWRKKDICWVQFQLSALPQIIGSFYGSIIDPEDNRNYRRTWKEIVKDYCSSEILIAPLPNGEVSKGTYILAICECVSKER